MSEHQQIIEEYARKVGIKSMQRTTMLQPSQLLYKNILCTREDKDRPIAKRCLSWIPSLESIYWEALLMINKCKIKDLH